MKRKLVRNISLLPFQKTFLQSKEKNLWLAAGLGTGKTYVACLYMLDRMLRDPDGFGLLVASTYKQLHNSILAQLFTICDELGLRYKYNALAGIFTLSATGARLMCMSAESYEQCRGIEFSYCLLEEACLYSEDAYDVIIGRIRQKSKLPLQIRLISTPRGFNWTYQKYVEGLPDLPFGEVIKKNKHTALLRAKSTDNFYLPDGYIETMAANYSEKMYLQEVEAEFVAGGGGAIYNAFNRKNHTYDINLQDHKGGILHVGMDFNVNPMTATISFISVENNEIILNIFDEVYLEDSDTYKMADELKKRYPDHHLVIAPDATGKARKTSSQKSDHAILKDAGFEVKLRARSNPHRIDRYNTVNGRLKTAQIRIDKRCHKLIRDLEQVTFEKNADHLTHISDALGYLAWQHIPVKPERKPTRTMKAG